MHLVSLITNRQYEPNNTYSVNRINLQNQTNTIKISPTEMKIEKFSIKHTVESASKPTSC